MKGLHSAAVFQEKTKQTEYITVVLLAFKDKFKL